MGTGREVGQATEATGRGLRALSGKALAQSSLAALSAGDAEAVKKQAACAGGFVQGVSEHGRTLTPAVCLAPAPSTSSNSFADDAGCAPAAPSIPHLKWLISRSFQ